MKIIPNKDSDIKISFGRFDLALKETRISEPSTFDRVPPIPRHEYRFTVDGISYRKSSAERDDDKLLPSSYNINDEEVANAIRNTPIGDFKDFFWLTIYKFARWNQNPYSLSISPHNEKVSPEDATIPEFRETGLTEFSLEYDPDLSSWKSSFSFSEFTEKLRSHYDALDVRLGKLHVSNDYEHRAIWFEYSCFPDPQKTIDEIVEKFADEIRTVEKQVIDSLQYDSTNDRLLTYFDFPEDVRTPCEQYLLYFSEFLRDLGIRANSTISEDAGHVLFSVTPVDGVDAMERVREALSEYLQLPNTPIANVQESIESNRLQYEIESLRHKLKMKGMENRMLQTEITQLNFWLEKYNNPGNNTGNRQNSHQLGGEVGESKTEKKAIGLTKVKKLEDWGLEVNLDEMFDRLKASFKKKSDDSENPTHES